MKSIISRFIALLLSLSVLFGCGREKKTGLEERPPLPSFQELILASKSWLDTVIIDPLELRRHGIKGKKKMGELFDAYSTIHEFLPSAEQQSIDSRLKAIAEITQKAEYHDMVYINDKQFTEDATSYLRLCYLLERRGFDTALYREEIKKAHSRLNDHMPTRGVNQQMAFHRYYNYFGLEEPFPLDKAYEEGIISGRWTAAAMNRQDVYGLTHEIFAVYRYGDEPDVEFFTEEDKIYLKGVLNDLIIRYMEENDPDLTAELVTSMCLLNLRDEPIVKKAYDYLFSSQNADGSFGNFEDLRDIYEDYVKEGYYLHTTSVVLKALSLLFKKL